MGKWLKENWFKLGILISITIFCISTSYYYLYVLPHVNNVKNTVSVGALNRNGALNGRSSKEDLEMQDLCSKRAEQYFNKNYIFSQDERIFAEYTSHYNRILNQCFILALVDNMHTGSHGVDLINVFEGKQYGQYEINKGELYPSECWVMNENKNCNSTIFEFKDNDVKSYMEN